MSQVSLVSWRRPQQLPSYPSTSVGCTILVGREPFLSRVRPQVWSLTWLTLCLALLGFLAGPGWQWAEAPPTVPSSPVASSDASPVARSAVSTSLIASRSERSYLQENLPQQISQTMATKPPVASSGTLTSVAGMRGCLRALGAQDSRVLAADLGLFEGQPSAVLLLVQPQGQRELWVVSPECRPGHDGMRYYEQLA